MQFVQTYDALYQQVGSVGEPALRHEDLQFDVDVRKNCGIALSQASNPSSALPPVAPAGAAACVIPEYQQQIAAWRTILQGAAAEEANRPIQDQVALQSRLQVLGFLPARAQLDGVFGTGTRAAIIQWQTSIREQPTGLLGNSDAIALLGNSAPTTAPSATSTAQNASPSIADAWQPYASLSSCLTQNGFSLETFIQQGVPPTDEIAAQAINQCQTGSSAASKNTAPSSTAAPTSGSTPAQVAAAQAAAIAAGDAYVDASSAAYKAGKATYTPPTSPALDVASSTSSIATSNSEPQNVLPDWWTQRNSSPRPQYILSSTTTCDDAMTIVENGTPEQQNELNIEMGEAWSAFDNQTAAQGDGAIAPTMLSQMDNYVALLKGICSGDGSMEYDSALATVYLHGKSP
jgi:peptidoglycan hydrolase-like protein with peptidoglycan-binding domain